VEDDLPGAQLGRDSEIKEIPVASDADDLPVLAGAAHIVEDPVKGDLSLKSLQQTPMLFYQRGPIAIQ
jgi:hypothetical protein